jgi:hypothetical protein
VQRQVRQFFDLSVFTILGNGATTLFWSDRWIHGNTIQDIAPEVVSMVGRKAYSSRTVAQALDNWHWVSDICGPLSLRGLQQYLLLWDTLGEVRLSRDADKHVWMHSSSGMFSSKSCYKAFFMGSISFEPWKRLWKSWAPPKCKFFLWLAIRNKCWAADRLRRRGLQHPVVCVLCDQEQETVQHLLCTCSFARQFWHAILFPLSLGDHIPAVDEISFADWWRKVPKIRKKASTVSLFWGLGAYG